MFNQHGQVIGLALGKFVDPGSGVENVGFALKLSYLAPLLTHFQVSQRTAPTEILEPSELYKRYQGAIAFIQVER